MTSPNPILAIHLMPEEKELNLLLGLINSLAEKFSGPRFFPHLTLCWGYPKDSVDVVKLCEGITNSLPRPVARVNGIQMGSSFPRTLYLTFEEDVLHFELHRRFRDEFEIPPEYRFYPHLSLLYGNLSDEEKSLLKLKMEELRYPIKISFSAIHIIAAQSSYTQPADIEAERLLARVEWPSATASQD